MIKWRRPESLSDFYKKKVGVASKSIFMPSSLPPVWQVVWVCIVDEVAVTAGVMESIFHTYTGPQYLRFWGHQR